MPGRHPFLRTIVVVLLVAWAIASDVPQLGQFWHTYGQNPYYSGGYFGDDRDWQTVSAADRMKFIWSGIVASPGIRCVLPTGNRNNVRVLTALAVPQPWTTSDAVVAALCFFGNVLFVVVGGWLVLIRPAPITWAFFACGVFWGPTDWSFSVALLPPALALSQMTVMAFIAGAAMWACLYFGLIFPSGQASGLKQTLARW